MAAMSGKMAGKGGGAAVALPPGFSLTPIPGYGEAARNAFATLTRKGGVLRVLLVATRTTKEEDVHELLGSPRYALKQKAPGIYEAVIRLEDLGSAIEPNVGPDGMFRWVDAGTRFYGTPVRGTDDVATVAIRWEGPPADLKLKLKQLGGTLVERPAPAPAATRPEPDAIADLAEELEVSIPDPDAGLHFATLPGHKLAELVLATQATSIEVRSVSKAGSPK